jgi:hypothetical protein
MLCRLTIPDGIFGAKCTFDHKMEGTERRNDPAKQATISSGRVQSPQVFCKRDRVKYDNRRLATVCPTLLGRYGEIQHPQHARCSVAQRASGTEKLVYACQQAVQRVSNEGKAVLEKRLPPGPYVKTLPEKVLDLALVTARKTKRPLWCRFILQNRHCARS